MEKIANSNDPSMSRDRQNQRQASAGGSLSNLAHALVLAGAVAAVFLDGAQQGSCGIFLVCAGAALVLCPPKIKVAGSLWGVATALILCASLAFLPMHWFPVPAWRNALQSLAVIPLPPTITPVPAQSAFWLALLVSAVLSGLFLLSQPLRSGTLILFALTPALVCGVYAALAIYARTNGWHYPFGSGDASFGFFPNRNHTATFLITGSLLAVGVLAVTLRDDRWLTAGLAAGSLTACVLALFFYSGSRGGIVFLLAGTLLWIIGLGRTHRHNRLLVSCAALLLAAGLLFFGSGSEAQTRITAFFQVSPAVIQSTTVKKLDSPGKRTAASEDTPLDMRVLIYEDTFSLIRAFPVTGTGLGTFAMVFPQYRNVSLSVMRMIHPESDWLMLTAEAGVPALLCLLALFWLLVRRLPLYKEHPYWPLRWACVVAALAAALHGLVDVPAHHLSLGWWMLALAGLGLQPGRVKVLQHTRAQHVLFILGGLGMLVLGERLIRAEWFGAWPLAPFAEERVQAEVKRAFAQKDYERATGIIRQACLISPMEDSLYYELGVSQLQFAETDQEVDADFRAARLLNPGWPAIPLQQGEAWESYDGTRTAKLWLEALARQQRIDRTAGSGKNADLGFYRDLIRQATPWPGAQQGLEVVPTKDPAFALAWLEDAKSDLVGTELPRWSSDQTFLQRLTEGQRRRFLSIWYRVGNRDNLARFINDHAQWQKAAWPIRLQQLADGGNLEQAVHAAGDQLHVSLLLPTPDRLGEAGETGPESTDPEAAFLFYWRTGNTVAAARVLDEAGRDDSPTPPAEIWRLKAALAARQNNWPIAWQNLQRYVHAVYGDEAW